MEAAHLIGNGPINKNYALAEATGGGAGLILGLVASVLVASRIRRKRPIKPKTAKRDMKSIQWIIAFGYLPWRKKCLVHLGGVVLASCLSCLMWIYTISVAVTRIANKTDESVGYQTATQWEELCGSISLCMTYPFILIHKDSVLGSLLDGPQVIVVVSLLWGTLAYFLFYMVFHLVFYFKLPPTLRTSR